MQVLFITRKFPPQKGGMENFSHGLITHYRGKKEVIALGKPQIHLLWFYPYAFLKALWLIWKKNIDLVHLGDGVMTPLGYSLKVLTGKPVVFTAMGLDISFAHPLYQGLMPFFFRRMDKVISISSATKNVCLERGIPENKIGIIPPGIEPSEWKIGYTKKQARQVFTDQFNIDILNKKVLLSVGRLARRKGFRWFVEEVMPKLSDDYIYLIIGEGGEITGFKSWFGKMVSEKELLRHTIQAHNLNNRVKLLGQVDFEILKTAYRATDVLVMPNIPVKGDMEGFGIVSLEAGILGTPTVASNLEGMQDAVTVDKTGILAEPQNTDSFIKALNNIAKLNTEELAIYIRENFSWQIIVVRYKNIFQKLYPKL